MGSESPTAVGVHWDNPAASFSFGAGCGGGTWTWASAPASAPDQWHQVTGVFDALSALFVVLLGALQGTYLRVTSVTFF